MSFSRVPGLEGLLGVFSDLFDRARLPPAQVDAELLRRAEDLLVLLALVCVELSDVLFAVDSIPAVFGVTSDPFIAFTSNAFALLGLRSLYTLIANAAAEFVYLEPAIAVVLGFIGLKLVGSFAGYEIPTSSSLLLVLGVLGSGVGLSVLDSTSKAGDDDEADQLLLLGCLPAPSARYRRVALHVAADSTSDNLHDRVDLKRPVLDHARGNELNLIPRQIQHVVDCPSCNEQPTKRLLDGLDRQVATFVRTRIPFPSFLTKRSLKGTMAVTKSSSGRASSGSTRAARKAGT